jgi:hypothetical protein
MTAEESYGGKQLQVRVPEIWNPFADEILLYPSFYTIIPTDFEDQHMQYLLSFYKSIVYSVLQAAEKNQNKIQLQNDQNHQAASDHKTTIVDCEWQSERTLSQFVVTRKPCVITISSVSDVKDVEQIISTTSRETQIVFAQLSKAFRTGLTASLLEQLFLVPAHTHYAQLDRTWPLASIRKKVNTNEALIQNLLSQRKIQYTIV